MYKNIGWTIKSLSIFFLVFGIIANLAVGIIFLSDEEPWIRIAIVFGGSFGIWASTIFIYGFGQIVENTDKLVAKQNEAESETDTPADNTEKDETVIKNSHENQNRENPIKLGRCNLCEKDGVEIVVFKHVDDNGIQYLRICTDCKNKLAELDDKN